MNLIYTSHKVSTEVDLRIVTKIIEILNNKAKDCDYFQIFEVMKNKLINRDEVPTRKEYKLGYTLKEKLKLWAIREKEENQEYWTILFPEEY